MRNTLLQSMRRRAGSLRPAAPRLQTSIGARQEISLSQRLPMTNFQAAVAVPTANAGRYLQQFCKHMGHKVAVEFTPDSGRVTFPRDGRGADWPGEAVLELRAHADHLECVLTASAEGQLNGLKDMTARHLDRFAFREAPLTFNWRDADA